MSLILIHSTQGGRINPQHICGGGVAFGQAWWTRGTAPVSVFNPFWALQNNMFIGPTAPQPETH